ncbi:MAG: NAD(P)/FAD-dependent oxidoreductase [Oscillospiraceae bacterium]|nr:NAD(P)/FAD-dependent oxidoreductase [Oscillospiraceae bacterium]
MTDCDVLIAGGGASGCFAAIYAARRGRRVLLAEGNDRLMRKLSITGKGRCNVTNDCDTDTLMRNIPRNPRFLYSAFSRCTPADVKAFFTGAGVPLKVERGRRVFPVSDKAEDIAAAMKREMDAAGVKVLLRTRVQSLLLSDGQCTGVRTADGQEIRAESVLLATGGASYPRTGSTGDGYRLAAEAGHTVIPPAPSLIPLETAEADAAGMQGLSLKNVTLTVTMGKKVLFSELGEMLFTHFGVSGPLVLSASCRMQPDRLSETLLTVNLKPGLTPEQLDARILRDFSEVPNRAVSNIMKGLLPASMIPVVLRRAEIPADKKAHDITKAERIRLGNIMQKFTLHPTAMRPVSEAIITRGGVSVKEVDPNTMASKLVSGLYFSGELLDVDAFTGGYNLQIAFATGHAAGEAV